jgi:hypothetical protein
MRVPGVDRLLGVTLRTYSYTLTSHREQLENLTVALLDAETLEGIDAYRAAGLPMNANPAVEAA